MAVFAKRVMHAHTLTRTHTNTANMGVDIAADGDDSHSSEFWDLS